MKKKFEFYICDDCREPIDGAMYCLRIRGILHGICKACFDKLKKRSKIK